jgi:hypothetical protein
MRKRSRSLLSVAGAALSACRRPWRPTIAQRGYSQVSMIVMILVIALAQQGLVYYQVRQLSITRGKVMGGQERDIRNAVDDYLKSWGSNIVSGKPVTSGAVTVANALSPTLAELSGLGHLHATINPATPIGGNWVIVIETSPSSCTLPGACNLSSSIYATTPLTMPNSATTIDSTALNAAIAEIGADGGFSEPSAPGTILGAGGWNRPNKNGAIAGTLFSIGGFGSATYTALKNVGDTCTTPGAVATSTTGQQLICRGTNYVTTLNALPTYRESSKVLVKDGDVVPKPTCETGGTPAFSFEMTQTAVDVAIVPPLQSLYETATDQGSSWKIVIHMKDRNTTDVTANTYNVSAIFHVQCFYP